MGNTTEVPRYETEDDEPFKYKMPMVTKQDKYSPPENDVTVTSPTVERFKSYLYSGESMGVFLPRIGKHCKFCTYAEPKQNHVYDVPSLHVPRSIFIVHNDNLVRVNYPGWIICNHCQKYSDRRYIYYTDNSYTLTASARSGNISFVTGISIDKKIHPTEFYYKAELGSILVHFYPLKAIYLPSVKIATKQDGNYYVVEIEKGGAIGFFNDADGKTVILDDLGNIVPFTDMDRTVIENDTIFIFTDGKMQIVIKSINHEHKLLSSKRIKNNFQTKPALSN